MAYAYGWHLYSSFIGRVTNARLVQNSSERKRARDGSEREKRESCYERKARVLHGRFQSLSRTQRLLELELLLNCCHMVCACVSICQFGSKALKQYLA